MWVSPAYAQALGAGGAGGILEMLLPFVLIFVIMYFSSCARSGSR
jgi:preprotein translocase subunit YajC